MDPGGPYGITQTLSAADADATALAVLPLFGDSLEARVVLAVGHADGVVRVWEVASGTLLASLQAHTEPLFSLAVLQVGDSSESLLHTTTIIISVSLTTARTFGL